MGEQILSFHRDGSLLLYQKTRRNIFLSNPKAMEVGIFDMKYSFHGKKTKLLVFTGNIIVAQSGEMYQKW